MKRVLPLAVVLLIAPMALGDDAADARKIVDRAIKEAGKGDKTHAITMSGKGTFYGFGDGVPYTGEWASQLPEKKRVEIKDAFIFVVDGDKGWTNASGTTMEMTKEQLDEEKENMYAEWVQQLVPLKNEGFTLKTVGETKVDDKPAIGVKVSHQGHRDLTLYFDKDNGLLVRFDQTVKDEQGKTLSQVLVIKEYVKVGDVKMPSKMVITRDGKKYVEGEMSDIKLSDRLPDSTFAKP
jgi:hypothetical protein